jgi:uncharacterized protein YdbL (DUF1318 family)
MLRLVLVVAVGLIASASMVSPSARADAVDEAQSILQTAEFTGGFIVHLGSGDGELTAELKQNEATQVQGLEQDA